MMKALFTAVIFFGGVKYVSTLIFKYTNSFIILCVNFNALGMSSETGY